MKNKNKKISDFKKIFSKQKKSLITNTADLT